MMRFVKRERAKTNWWAGGSDGLLVGNQTNHAFACIEGLSGLKLTISNKLVTIQNPSTAWQFLEGAVF